MPGSILVQIIFHIISCTILLPYLHSLPPFFVNSFLFPLL